MDQFDQLDEITQMLADTSLREELPATYQGKLPNEFESVTALNELACTFMAGKESAKAQHVYGIVRTFIHLVNKTYFAMYGENAPRFSETDLELAQAHAINNIPMECSHDQFLVDQDAIDRASRATSNICNETLEHLNFIVTEFREKYKKAKEQCKRAGKYAAKLQVLVKSVTNLLDREEEIKHRFVDKSTITYSDMTARERKLKDRKRRNR